MSQKPVELIRGDTPTYRNAAGSTTIVNNTVTVSVTVKDAETLSPIQGARVLVEADVGGNLPVDVPVSITRSGSTAIVTHTNHGLKTGDMVTIRGAEQPEYNGVHTITVVDANTYTYTVPGTPASPATGTITSTYAILYGTTDTNGQISTSSFNYTADQPVRGTARKASSTPFYRPGKIVGTITSAGFNTTVLLIEDA